MSSNNLTLSNDLDVAAAKFREAIAALPDNEQALPSHWDDAMWRNLFHSATIRKVNAGDALIQRGDPEQTLYFVLRGRLEVIVHSVHGDSMGAIDQVGVGAVLGEMSFFDGKPRSASVWAVQDCDVAAMTLAQYREFEKNHPESARDLLFAFGRILATRLRRTNDRVAS